MSKTIRYINYDYFIHWIELYFNFRNVNSPTNYLFLHIILLKKHHLWQYKLVVLKTDHFNKQFEVIL